jgi:hypothetical protein
MSVKPLLFCLVLLALVIIGGCAQFQPAGKVMIAQGVGLSLVLPPWHGMASQLVKGTYRNETHTLVMQLQSSSTEFVMAGLTPTGTRLFTANYDGHQISSWQSPLFTAPFDGSFLIADFLLTTLELPAINRLLSNGSASEYPDVAKNAVERNIYNSEAKPVVRIRYSNALHRDEGVVDYCHLERNYCLHIENLDSNAAP